MCIHHYQMRQVCYLVVESSFSGALTFFATSAAPFEIDDDILALDISDVEEEVVTLFFLLHLKYGRHYFHIR